MKMTEDKKAFVFTIPVIVGAIVLALIVFGGFGLLTWFLAQNLWRIIGVALLAFVGIRYMKGAKMDKQTTTYLVIAGVVLVLLPFVSDIFNQSFSVILP